jgi:tetratricopeptide (TPR) repeat protein
MILRGPVKLVVLAVVVAAAFACSSPAEKKKAYLESGNRFAAENRLPEAAIEYRNAIEIDPRFAEARVGLAQTYARLGDHANALKEYVRAADLLPENTNVQLTAGAYLLLAGRPEEARARADAALKREPRNIEAHVLRGNALAGLKDFEAAVSEIEGAIQLDPGRSTTYTTLGAVEAVRGRREEAEQAFKRAVALDPKRIDAHLALANHYWAAGRQAEAEQSILAALHLEPSNPLANRAMALFCMTSGRLAEAEKYVKVIAGTDAAPFALGDYYLVAGRSSEAIREFERLRSHPRTAATAERRLVRAYAVAGDSKKSEALADEILAREPRDPEMLLAKGQLLALAGKNEEAFEQIKRAADAAPTSTSAQFALGKTLARRGDREGAKRAFNEVLRLNPRAGAAHAELANLYLADGSTDAALKAATQAVGSHPENVDARLTLARSLAASGDLAGSGRVLDALLEQHPAVAAVHVERGRLAIRKRDLADARLAFERALQIDAGSVPAIAGLTLLDMSAGDLTGARSRIDAELARRPGNVEVMLLAAQVYTGANEVETAERLLRKAIETDASLLPAYSMLGQLYLKQQNLDQALREFDSLAERHPNPVAALTMAGIILQAQGRNESARQRFEKALAVDPRAAIAANNLAWMYADSGENLDIALQLAQSAVAGLPESAEALDTLGWVYYKKRLSSLAVSTFKRTVDKSPKSPIHHYHLGLAYAQAGEAALARGSLERALSLDSSFPGAEDARRTLSGLSPARRDTSH